MLSSALPTTWEQGGTPCSTLTTQLTSCGGDDDSFQVSQCYATCPTYVQDAQITCQNET